MNPLRALIVEDEAPARQRLVRLLERHAGQVKVVGEAADGREALARIEALELDVLFLDIQMPGMDGFALLRQVRPRPHVIFITAYADYAVQAFETNAVDYLLKPVEPERLAAALARLHDRLRPLSTGQLQALADALKPAPVLTSLPVKLGDRFFFVRLDTVTHFEARDKYVYLHTADGKEYLLDQSLTALSEKLPDRFLQVHRSAIVNLDYIREVRKYFNNRFILYLDAHPTVKLTTGPTYAGAVQAALAI